MRTGFRPLPARAAAGDCVLEGIKLLTCPKDLDKQLYLRQVAETGDRDVLLVKLADRICNSLDYVKTGAEKDAARYFHYADCVFDAVCILPLGDQTVKSAIANWNKTAGHLNDLTGYESVIGCMLGGAVGDALGAPVEFAKFNDIKRLYGRNGITGYVVSAQ